ncbi:MAG: carbohydrate ABC transporter permease [Anaerolineae bacterium]
MEQQQGVLSKRAGLAFITPALAFIFIFLIFPFAWTFYLSFTNQALTGPAALNPQLVGLDNYLRLFDLEGWLRSGQFGRSLIITTQFVFGSALIGQAVLGMTVAWIFFRHKGLLRELVYTLAILAWIIPEVVVAFTWIAFLDRDFGTLNAILSSLGLGQPDWHLKHPLLAITFFNTWRGAAFSILLFSSALATVPPSYIETAEVAGASAWQKLRDIILPLMRGHILTDLILITLWTFNVFTPFLITGGGPAFKTELVSIYTYRVAFKFFEFGQGAAIAVVVMLINLLLALGYLTLLRRQAVYR